MSFKKFAKLAAVFGFGFALAAVLFGFGFIPTAHAATLPAQLTLKLDQPLALDLNLAVLDDVALLNQNNNLLSDVLGYTLLDKGASLGLELPVGLSLSGLLLDSSACELGARARLVKPLVLDRGIADTDGTA